MSTPAQASGFDSFAAFYPFYLDEHSNLNCRRLHFVGTTGVIALFVASAMTLDWRWLLLVTIAGYGFAWIGHFVFEKNKPATFKYPLYSLAADWVMYKDMLLGKVGLLR
ncbi:MAG: DUF962 domain-containing protein [Pseudomonadota bacterium]